MYHHCQSVNDKMKKRNIPVKCYWYKAALKNKLKLNQTAIHYQFDYWAAREEFLTEEEVLQKIQNERKDIA